MWGEQNKPYFCSPSIWWGWAACDWSDVVLNGCCERLDWHFSVKDNWKLAPLYFKFEEYKYKFISTLIFALKGMVLPLFRSCTWILKEEYQHYWLIVVQSVWQRETWKGKASLNSVLKTLLWNLIPPRRVPHLTKVGLNVLFAAVAPFCGRILLRVLCDTLSVLSSSH